MIPRRIAEHVRAQNWFAVAIDFVIVVLGVFVGIQVSNWNAERADRVSEARYLAEIAEDLRADLEEIDLVRSTAEWRASAAEAVLAEAGAPPRRREVASAFGTLRFETEAPFASEDPYAANGALSMVPTLDGNRHAYGALISTGDFRLLRDRALARAIQAYYAAVDEVRDFEVTLEIVRESVAASRHRHGISNFGATTLDELGAAAAADRELAAQIDTYRLFSANHARQTTRLREQASALIAKIEGAR